MWPLEVDVSVKHFQYIVVTRELVDLANSKLMSM
jgi:hypothetical protein